MTAGHSFRIEWRREKLRWCEDAYLIEKERKITIERHAQFYASIITVFIALLAINIHSESCGRIEASCAANEGVGFSVVIVSIFCVVVLCCGLIFSMLVFFPARRRKPFPENLFEYLHIGEEGNGRFDNLGEDELVKIVFKRSVFIASAVETNQRRNSVQARRLIISASLLFSAVFIYAIFEIALMILIAF